MKYAELSKEARENVLDYFRYAEVEYDWYLYIYEDFIAVASRLGFDIDSTRDISFSGFGCQSDGAAFEAYYRGDRLAVEDLKEYCPRDEAILDICKRLAGLETSAQLRYSANWRASINISPLGHSQTISSLKLRESKTCFDIEPDDMGNTEEFEEAEETILEAAEDLSTRLFEILWSEYDWLTSDEYVEERIVDSDYEFDEDGHVI
jgi:hypothetical protein